MRFSQFKLWLLLVVSFSCTQLTNAQEPTNDGEGSVQVGQPAPNFTLDTAGGKRVSLKDYHGDDGKYVVAVFVRAHW